MADLFLYSDVLGDAILREEGGKAVLIGGDFGYGNFGDILQHAGAIDRFKRCSDLQVVSVLSVDAMSKHVTIGALREGYGADVLIFVSDGPLDQEAQATRGLVQVANIRDITCIQLYGGGFLTERWGDFVLGVAEFFLRKLPSVAYFISGQQVSPAYAGRVAEHIRTFKPALLAVRDSISQKLLKRQGVDAQFSFDDAVEPLLELSRRLPVRRGPGMFIHLNSSGYTGNDCAEDSLVADMAILGARSPDTRVVLVQAYQDRREEVLDSMETLKRLEAAFPFPCIEVVMLVSMIMGRGANTPMSELVGDYAYACSYHVTLWLQLNGIPCWLRSENAYYEQKRESLGVHGDFEDFLENLPKVDHSRNLLKRAKWTAVLEGAISGLTRPMSLLEFGGSSADDVYRTIHFKGEPSLADRLDYSWNAILDLKDEKKKLLLELQDAQSKIAESAERLDSSDARISEVQHERDALDAQIQVQHEQAVQQQANLDAAIQQQEYMRERLESMQTQVSILERALDEEAVIRQAEHKARELVRQEAEGRERNLASRNEELLLERGRLKAHLKSAQDTISRLKDEEVRANLLSGRVEALTAQVTELGSSSRALSGSLKVAEAGWFQSMQGNEVLVKHLASLKSEKEQIQTDALRLEERLESAVSRMNAYSEQLTSVGEEARSQRRAAEVAFQSLESLGERERGLSAVIAQIHGSRSWRITKPMRAGARFLKTRRFDSAGEVGLFELTRRLGQALPLPEGLASRVGRILRGLRRN